MKKTLLSYAKLASIFCVMLQFAQSMEQKKNPSVQEKLPTLEEVLCRGLGIDSLNSIDQGEEDPQMNLWKQALSPSSNGKSILPSIYSSRFPITGQAMQILVQNIRLTPTLENLQVFSRFIGDNEFKNIVQNLNFIPNLKLLNIENIGIGLDGIKALAENLNYLPKLTNLSVGRNNFGIEGIKIIAQQFHNRTDLILLSFEGSGIKDEDLQNIIPYLPPRCSVDLFQNPISEKGFDELRAAGFKIFYPDGSQCVRFLAK